MTPPQYFWFIFLAVAAAASLSAAEITGKVRDASGDAATVVIDGDTLPAVGDSAEIFFKIPGADEEISVASGKVTAVDAKVVKLKIEKTTGTVEKDQLARIKSASTAQAPAVSPTPKAPSASPAASNSTGVTRATPSIPGRSPTPGATTTDENPQIVIDKNEEFPPFDLSDFLGVSFALQKDGSVIVTEVKANSIGAQMGLASGDRILEINSKPVPLRETTPKAITQEELGMLVGAAPDSAMQIVIERGADKERTTISLPPSRPPSR